MENRYDFYNEVIDPIVQSINFYGERNAFVIDEQEYTYETFGRYISKIRLAIRKQSFNNRKVGLVINDDLETYASIVALWLEGLAYVPLHPEQPLERCLDIVEQVDMDLILDSSSQSRYSKCVLATNDLQFEAFCLESENGISEDEVAYILFTSGSTGKPKGVVLSRRNLSAFMNSFWQSGITITHEDRCLQYFDLTFDISIQSYLVAITRGACVYTVPHGQIKYIYASALIEDHKLTFGAMAPSTLRYIKPYFDEIDASSLRVCLMVAEASPLQLIEEWFECAKNVEVYDFYGPTECTIYCTFYKLERGSSKNKALNGMISIGKPMANVTAIIADENGNELPTGEKGELCIAGDQVTLGYWNNEAQNKKAFFHKEIKGKQVRFYRTGDLCYKDREDDIMYSGRIDHQAKIQGFRVELGEIEHHAREFMQDKNAVCVAFENSQQLTEIAMFVEAEEFDTAELMSYMRAKMPSYMIPTRLIFEPRFPLNANDKVDKNKLKEKINA